MSSDDEEVEQNMEIANQSDFIENMLYFDALDAMLPRTRKYTVHQRIDPFTFYDEDEFKTRYRFSKSYVELIYTLVDGQNTLEPLLVREGFTVPGITKLLIALRYFAVGGRALTIADTFGVSKSLVLNTVADVSAIIAERMNNIRMPTSRAEILNAKAKFHRFCGFPLIIGAGDGTQIKVRSFGGNDAEYYRNRKQYFSINCHFVVSADVNTEYFLNT